MEPRSRFLAKCLIFFVPEVLDSFGSSTLSEQSPVA